MRIAVAKVSEPARRGHALFKAYETPLALSTAEHRQAALAIAEAIKANKGIAPFNPRRRMRAIRAAADCSTAVNRAPRIVLPPRRDADDTGANSQHEQQEPHSLLLEWPPSYKCLFFVFYSMLTREMRRAGIAANVAKLPELLRDQK